MKIKTNIALLILLSSLLFISCDISSEHREKDYKVGSKGEHPKAHTLEYDSTFIVLKHDFYKTIEAFHTFAQKNHFEPKLNKCFNSLYEVTFDNEKLPCIITYAEKGWPVKVHITYSVHKKDFNNSKKVNFLEYSVKISTLDGKRNEIVDEFRETVTPRLLELNKEYIKKL